VLSNALHQQVMDSTLRGSY